MRRLPPVALLAVVGLMTTVGGKRCHTKLCRQEAQYLRQSMKLDVDPCSDFYTYACGNFMHQHPVPEPNITLSSFEIADKATTIAIRSILSSPHQPTDSGALKKAKTMYACCMDDAVREEHGLHPLRRMLQSVGGWPLITDDWTSTGFNWTYVANIMSQYGVPLFFDVSVKPHPSNVSLNIIHIDPPGLPVAVPLQRPPPRRQETMDALLFSPNTEEILQYLTDVALELHGREDRNRSDVEQELRQVLVLAKELQKHHQQSLLQAMLDEPLTVAVSALSTEGGLIDWLQFLQAVFVRSGANVTAQHLVHITGSSYVQSVLQLFNNTDSRVVANYIATCLVMYYAPDTTDHMFEYLTRLYHQLKVFPQNYPRWQYCVNKVLDYPDLGLSAALARTYLQDHDASLHLVAQLFEDMRNATVDLLDDNSWVDVTIKSLVMTKMQAMSAQMGFPAWMLNNTQLDHFYNKLLIHSHDHFGNVVRMHSYMFAANLATLDSKDLKPKWPTSPFLANAFYEFQHNTIFLPVAILQHPFYTGQDNTTGRRAKPKKKSQKKKKEGLSTLASQKGRRRRQRRQSILLAVDYGRLGSVIGHEITHGFDDSGHLYNEHGDVQLWSDSMEQTFDTKSRCFTRQYDQDNRILFFDSTLGEDISDNGGVRKAYTAFKNAWSRAKGLNTTLPSLPRFTAEQLFFLSYATVWCYSGDELAADWHSRHKDRANRPLSNMKEFGAAWNCPAGSPMNPVDKCVLW